MSFALRAEFTVRIWTRAKLHRIDSRFRSLQRPRWTCIPAMAQLHRLRRWKEAAASEARLYRKHRCGSVEVRGFREADSDAVVQLQETRSGAPDHRRPADAFTAGKHSAGPNPGFRWMLSEVFWKMPDVLSSSGPIVHLVSWQSRADHPIL